jgi:predicted AlkP superfamily pyrophosphatase or phosphodiesterase
MRRKFRLQIPVLIACFFLVFETTLSKPTRKHSRPTKLVILSIDGFLGEYFASPEILSLIPNLKLFSEKSAFSFNVESVNPSVTYPAHTSMMTGADPGIHGIYNNTLLDPFEKNDGGWMWYAEDIQVESLWSLAKKKGKKVGNVFWPVTVGADIDWNLPQYWRKKISEDDKLLRALSTPGLHKKAELATSGMLNDTTKDEVKFKTANWLFDTYQPDLLLVYTTDLDSTHHGYGPYSDKAKEKLKEIDSLFGEFIQKLKLYEREDIALILISDHGFYSSHNSCAPNLYLLKNGFIQSDANTFDFIFKSSGGSALLLPGNRAPTQDELRKIKMDLELACPGATMSFDPKKEVLKSQHPDAVAWLTTKENLYFSGTRKGEIFTKNKTPIYGHGYDNALSEMQTIGGVYYKGIKDKDAWKLDSVKDVFNRACSLLQLNCPKMKSIKGKLTN